MGKKRLTDEQVKEIIQLRRGGMTYKDIGNRFDVSANSIYNQTKKSGVDFKYTAAITQHRNPDGPVKKILPKGWRFDIMPNMVEDKFFMQALIARDQFPAIYENRMAIDIANDFKKGVLNEENKGQSIPGQEAISQQVQKETAG